MILNKFAPFEHQKPGNVAENVNKVSDSLSSPRDLRPHFISFEMYMLMNAVMSFAKDYVCGAYQLNNLKIMNCQNFKRTTQLVYNSKCDLCKVPFKNRQNAELYLLVDTKKSLSQRFTLVCNLCNVSFNNSAIECYQLYPNLSHSTVLKLCEYQFVTKYLFNIDLSYTEKTTTSIDQIKDIYQSFKKIIKNKASNEEIVSIKLLTYNPVIFVETIDGYHITIDSNNQRIVKFTQNESNMLRIIKEHKFINYTYFYEVKKRIYTNTNFDYVPFFAKPCSIKRITCSKCKCIFYKKKHPILYCSKCGFTKRLYFEDALVAFDPTKVKFNDKCVKKIKTQLYCLVYYDMSLHLNV
ncbi:major early-transcribed protein 53 [Apocheima cinerarium nucleopolyhedrovirus]|uniref:major early-transcribed protein 53 n=1 Tax=Apocheima cinerarium nucleopolyhedrovirus TaxID=307461 RepID=UPI0001D920CF|nr:major early-transcribed protein 53 [Apocheima cinerarium nucleopolyhedrovirus]ADB84468.1 major early-transcribed protein 53 [Apocheima cinerarium nucleopolyhedrovirus]